MSDYCRNKTVMYPLEKDTLNKLGVETAWELLAKIPKTLRNCHNDKYPYFEIECMYDGKNYNYYLSYVLFSSYGKECGDFGRNRKLSDTEQIKYKKIFEEFIPDINPDNFKYVDYCYYNCSESWDYYKATDDFSEEI